MKRILFALFFCFVSAAAIGQFRQNYDTIKAVLLISNINKKQPSGLWCINGCVVKDNRGQVVAFLGRKRKPIPKYIHVWQYTVK